MTVFYCTECTEELKNIHPSETVICPHCAHRMHWAPMEKEQEELHAKAAWYLRDEQFYNALQMYDIICRRWEDDWAAPFGAVLAQYGVKYETDHEGHYTFTCRRTMSHGVRDDEYYKRAIASAPASVKPDYEETARLIDEAQKKNEADYSANAPVEESRDYRTEALSEDYLSARERYLQKEREEEEKEEQRRAEAREREKDAATARENRRRIAEKKAARKKLAILFSAIAVLCALLVGCTFAFVLPALRGAQMRDALDKGDKESAAQIARKLTSEDAKEIASRLRLYGLSVSDTVTLGQWEQDGNKDNGKEKLDWIVLRVENGTLTLLAQQVIDCQMYQKDKNSPAYWETCSLRAWLNDDFFAGAFSENEAALIELTHNLNPDNTRCGTKGGNDTDDRVYLLSTEEAETLLTEEMRPGVPTPYAAAAGTYLKKGCDSTYWWLRSPGSTQNSAGNVSYDGTVEFRGAGVDYKSYGVRPVITVRIADYE